MKPVSCRVMGVVFDALYERQIPSGRLLAGLPYTEPMLREPKRRIEWEAMVELVERFEELVGGTEELERIGYEHFSTSSYSNIRRLASVFTSPRDLYWLGVSWVGPNLFGITKDHFETLPNGQIVEVIEIPEPYAPCPALFHIIGGALRATPSLIGMGDALVERDIQPRRAKYTISPPEKRFSLRRTVRRLFSFGSVHQLIEELDDQQTQLRSINHTLEQTVRALRISEARLTAILELDSDIRYSIRLHPDGHREELWLTGALASFQRSQASHDIRRTGACIHPDDAAAYEARFRNAVGKEIYRLRYRVITPDGDQHWIRESIRQDTRNSLDDPLSSHEAGCVIYNGTLTDVTIQVQTETDLQRLVSAVDQANDGIVVVSPSLAIIYANPAFHRIFGHPLGALIGREISNEIVDGMDQQVLDALAHQVRKNGIGRSRISSRAGRETHSILDATVASVVGADGKRENFVGIVRDVTREVELEGQILFAANMDALGQLASGLAHDFNNLLMVIQSEASSLMRHESDLAETDTALSIISDAATHGGHLVRQLFTMSRTELDEPKLIDVNDFIVDFVSFARGSLAPMVEIQLELPERSARIRVGAGQLLQVLVNLAFNARDAMPNGGLVTIASGTIEIDAESAARLEIGPGAHVWISVSDTGVGMSTETQTRVFEPLYSTKSLGQGSGLGLATAKNSMRESNGGIEVRSTLGSGSTFTLYFPEPDGSSEGGGESESDEARESAGRR